jgi:hypothetical protein
VRRAAVSFSIESAGYSGQPTVYFEGLPLSGLQLHPWLVPHSVQQPQAPARITLLEPQFEQVMSIYILPSAVCTFSAWVLPFT